MTYQGKGPRAETVKARAQKVLPHLRRTKEQIKEQWILGDYSASGYLAALFGAMKAEGLNIVIRSVKEFCKEWEIGERRFYRGKAKLISQGRLEEEIHGTLVVRLTADKIVSMPDSTVVEDDDFGAGYDNTVSLSDSGIIENPPIAMQGKGSTKAPDLYRSFSDLSHLDPPTPPEPERERNILLFDQDGEPIQSYREWLTRRAENLPQRVGVIELWIEKNAAKKTLQRAFIKHSQDLTQANIPPWATDPVENTETNPRQEALARLKAKWTMPRQRPAAIAEAEDWGFVVTESGIEDVQEG